jgi:hypothetical protein
MLKEVTHWMLLTGSVLDTLLLARVLGFRLYRVYAFITLDCLIGAMIDWVSMYLGWDSPESVRVMIYTRFLFAVLTPLIAWDVFEEVKPEVAKVRRLEAIRMVLSLLIIGLFSLLLLANVTFGDSPEAEAEWPAALGLYLWGGSCITGVIFLWRTWRAARKLELPFPRNTTVWWIYYMLTLGSSVVYVAFLFSGWKLNPDMVNVVMTAFLIGCTVFCLVRLRASSVQMASENEK